MLSKTEMNVAAELRRGKSNKQIADILCVCEKTVKFHLTNIFKKTGVSSRSEFIAQQVGTNYVGVKVSEFVSVREARAEVLPNPQDKRNMQIVQKSQEDKIQFIDQQFKVSNTVEQLHSMMKEVTKTEITPATVNAACNCVARLNETINTAIMAARFLNER